MLCELSRSPTANTIGSFERKKRHLMGTTQASTHCQSDRSGKEDANFRVGRQSCESVCPLQGSKSPKSRKEGFGVQKPPFPTTPEKGALSQKIPIFLVVLCKEMAILLTQGPLFWGGGKWGFFGLRNPPFPILGISTPVRGKRIRNTRAQTLGRAAATSSRLVCLS